MKKNMCFKEIALVVFLFFCLFLINSKFVFYKNTKNIENTVLIENYKEEYDQVRFVNYRINNIIKYQSDQSLWGIDDYWATPNETLIKGSGDCEDFVFLKFFSLIKSGVPENKLMISYVIQKRSKIAHMVLLYKDKDDILVLDNVFKKMRKLEERSDLSFVYAFSNKNLFIFDKNNPKKISNTFNSKQWNDLLKKL